jgi:membrane protein implicated in regulation of membrane protease activity
MFRNIVDFVMPIAVGVWIGIGISNYPKIASYVNVVVMIAVFICASSLAWRFHKKEKKKDTEEIAKEKN